jgi:hypothetical protein
VYLLFTAPIIASKKFVFCPISSQNDLIRCPILFCFLQSI